MHFELPRFVFFFLAISFSLTQLQGQLVNTVAGQLEETGDADGQALVDALFNNPHGIAIDKYGRVYIADRWNHKIKKFDTNTGLVTTLAGTGNIGSDDGPGNVARFYSPWGLTCDSVGNVYVADTKNYLIRKIDTMGMVTTIAGSGSFGVRDGSAVDARFADPTGITITPDGTLYVCDHVAHTIRKITPSGVVTTIAGRAFITGDMDGAGSVARFNRPYGIELDWDGSIIVADEWNHKIRRVQPNGFTSTIAGSGNLGSDDGHASQARFNYPWDVVADRNGVIYVMDGYNHVMRRIEGDTVTTYVGEAGNTGGLDGYGIQASFSGATTLCMDHRNNAIYVGDAFNELIRRVDPSSGVALFARAYYPNGDSTIYQNGDTICGGETVTFISTPDNYANYDFYVDEVLMQSLPASSYTQSLTSPSTVNVQLKATDEDGIEFVSNTFTLHVVNLPKADFRYQLGDEVPTGYTVNFQSQSVGATHFSWDFGDPGSGVNNTSTLENPSHIYAQVGVYDVQLAVRGPGGCVDTVFRADFVSLLGLNTQPASFQSGDSLCVGDSLLLTANSDTYDIYEFYVNNALVQTSASRDYMLVPSLAGSFDVYVKGKMNNGASVNSTVITVNAVSSPTPTMSYAFDYYDPASGFVVNFSGETAGALAYIWNFGDPGSGADNRSSLSNPTHIYAMDGLYDISLITIGHAGCADTLENDEFVKLVNLISHDIAWGDTICTGSSLNFSASISGFDGYDFYVNDVLLQRSASPDFEHIPDIAGAYTIQVIAKDSDGRDIPSPTYNFYTVDKPLADFTYTELGLNPGGYTVDFLATTPLGVSYLWSFGDPGSGDQNISSLSAPTHTYKEFGTYDVSLIVSAGGSCTDTITREGVILFEDKPSNLFIPSAFTPNGDGLNDVLLVRGQNIIDLDFKVFNEWGQLIFKSANQSEGWNGTYNGAEVEPDTYVYVAYVTLADGETIILKGKTTLLR